MTSKQELDQIRKQWHEDWKDSGLFGCFDNAENELADWWIRIIKRDYVSRRRRLPDELGRLDEKYGDSITH